MADQTADSSCFVELMLEIIRDSLKVVSITGSSDQVGKPVARLLAALGSEELSAMELMKRLGLSHRPTFRKNYLDPALSANMIVRTIPDKPNSMLQKYRRSRS